MREYLLVMLTSGLTTYLLSGLCRQAALRWGAVAKVRSRDVHTVPIPYFGGVAMLGEWHWRVCWPATCLSWAAIFWSLTMR